MVSTSARSARSALTARALPSLGPSLTGRALVVAGALLAVSAMLAAGATDVRAQGDAVELLGTFDPGSECNDVWGYSAPDGTELAILGTVTGTSFVDVTDPADPREVAFIEGQPSIWRDMKTYGTYAYSVNEGGGGLQIIDLSDPSTPILVNAITRDFTTAHNIFVDEGAGTLWALGTPRGTFIYDLTADPSSPDLITNWTGPYLHDVFARDGLAFGAAINDRALLVLDVSDLPIVDLLSTTPYQGALTHNTWLTDDGRYCLTTDESPGGHVIVWDVANPLAPVQVGRWVQPDEPRSIVHNAFVEGRFAYVSWYTTGVQILDLTNPEAPVRVGSYDTYPGAGTGFAGAWGVYPYARNGLIYASDISTGLYVLRFDGERSVVSGRVRDGATGEPLAGVAVTVEGHPERATTTAAGTYELRLLPGDYDLAFSLWGFDPRVEEVALEFGLDTVLDVDLAPTPQGDVAGVVADEDGPLASGVRVEIEGRGLSAVTDDDGRFTFLGLPAGEYALVARRFGLASETRRVAVEPGEVAATRLHVFVSRYRDDFEADAGWTVGPDTATDGIWQRVDPVGSGGGSIQPEHDHSSEGTHAFVTGQGRTDLAAGEHDVDGGATTLTSPAFDTRGMARPVLAYHRWYVNDAGANPGEDIFVVEASGDGGETWSEIESTGESHAEWRRSILELPAAIAGSAELRVRFRASDERAPSLVEAAVDDVEIFDARGRVEGRVVSAGTGTPVAMARVVLPSASGEIPADPDGWFELTAASGPLDVVVEGFGHYPREVALTVPLLTTAEPVIDLTAMPSQPVRGIVRARDGGTPLADVVVECLDTPLVTRTGPDGRYHLDVPVGSYRLRVGSDEFVPVIREITVTEPGGPIQLDVDLLAGFVTGVDRIFPNPMRAESVLRFQLARAGRVRLDVFDSAGRRVRALFEGDLGVGAHEIRWDGRDDRGAPLASGIYYQRFDADGVSSVERVARLR